MKNPEGKMKNRIFSLLFLLLMAALAAGCTPGNGPESSPVLYGVTEATGDSHSTNTSWLYEISTENGTATAIGDTGFQVTSIAYDRYTDKLYGTARYYTVDPNLVSAGGYSTEIIEIDKVTGEGSLIGTLSMDIICIAFNSSGTAVIWNRTGDGAGNLLFLDIETGETGLLFHFADAYYMGSLAFNNSDTLYLLNRYYQPYVNTIDMSGGGYTYQGAINDATMNWYYNGAFHPQTGKFWSLDINPYLAEPTQYRNLLVADVDTLTLDNEIPTLDYLQAITFGYK